MPNYSDFDVTSSVVAIERLKCNLLNDIAALFDVLTQNGDLSDERAEIISDLILNAYVLGGRLGASYPVLDKKLLAKLRLLLLMDDKGLSGEYSALSRHIDKR